MQVQLNGPVGLVAVTVGVVAVVVQRLAMLAGMAETDVPLALPQTPITGAGAMVEQVGLLPPLRPVQDQVKGPKPEPVTKEEFPGLHRFVVGVVVVVAPLALPQAPFTGIADMDVEQLALAPPLMPVHVQVKGPGPLTVVEVPVTHRPVLGADETFVPLALPQAPSCRRSALQLASLPPLLPVQVQVKGPKPVTVGIFPVVAQRFVAGTAANAEPFALPQAPATADGPPPPPPPPQPKSGTSNAIKAAPSRILDLIIIAHGISLTPITLLFGTSALNGRER